MTLELRVDVATRRIEGTNTLRVVGRVAGSDVLTLDALEFVYCRAEAEGVEAEYDGQRLRVRWSTPLAVGEEREVRVAYAVEAPRAGLYGSPHAAADPHASPFVITDAETERARHWMPCVDHPSVRTTLDWSLRSGAEWTALAGDYLGEEHRRRDEDDALEARTAMPRLPRLLLRGALLSRRRRDLRWAQGRGPDRLLRAAPLRGG